MNATPTARQLRACACGCEGQTARTFVPGHDARLVSQLGNRVAAGELTVQAAVADARKRGASELLLVKLEASATRKLADATEKAANKAKRDQERELRASRPSRTREVTFQMGRWSYTGKRVGSNDIEFTDKKGNTRRVDVSKVKIAA